MASASSYSLHRALQNLTSHLHRHCYTYAIAVVTGNALLPCYNAYRLTCTTHDLRETLASIKEDLTRMHDELDIKGDLTRMHAELDSSALEWDTFVANINSELDRMQEDLAEFTRSIERHITLCYSTQYCFKAGRCCGLIDELGVARQVV